MEIIRFIKNTAVFFLGSILSKLLTFFLLPVYTKYISPADFGYYDLSVTYIHAFAIILFFDIWLITMRYMYERNDENMSSVVIHSGFTIFGRSLCVLIVGAVAVGMLFHIKYMSLIISYGVVTNLQQMFLYIVRGYKKNMDFVISGTINTLVTLVLNILLIVYFKMDFSALYISSILGHLIQCIYIQIRTNCLHALSPKYKDKKLTREMFRVALPLCINSAAYWLLTSLNKVVLSNIYSTEMNGIYAIGHKFGAALMFVTSCFTFAWQDLSFSKDDPKSQGRYYSNACEIYLIFLSIGLSLLLPIFNLLYPFLVHQSYDGAFVTIPFFLTTALVSAFSSFVGNIFYAIKDTKFVSISMIIASLTNMTISYPIIKVFDIVGTQAAVSISFIVNIVVECIVLRKRINLKIRLRFLLVSLACILVSSLIYFLGGIMPNLIWIAILSLSTLWICRDKIKELITVFVAGINNKGKNHDK